MKPSPARKDEERSRAVRNSIKVYPWSEFVAFIHRECEPPQSGRQSHPILDQVASDLHTGALQRRDSRGQPLQPWALPAELLSSYLLPKEVDERPVMRQWRMSWDTKVKMEPQLSVAEEYRQFGWKGALKLEANRIRTAHKEQGISVPNTDLSQMLVLHAAKNNIKTSHGKTPSKEYIRKAVLGRAKPENPAIKNPK